MCCTKKLEDSLQQQNPLTTRAAHVLEDMKLKQSRIGGEAELKKKKSPKKLNRFSLKIQVIPQLHAPHLREN